MASFISASSAGNLMFRRSPATSICLHFSPVTVRERSGFPPPPPESKTGELRLLFAATVTEQAPVSGPVHVKGR